MGQPKIDAALVRQVVAEWYELLPDDPQAIYDALQDLVMWGQCTIKFEADGSTSYIPFDDVGLLDVAPQPATE